MAAQTEPLVFISHKHTDKAIAEVVANFIRTEANTPIRIFLSSNPSFEGPKFGKEINKQLCNALWETDVLILVYTTAEEQDWSWCMWECGVAIDPAGPETTMIVFQCGNETPKIFAGSRVVNVRKLDEMQGFLKQYFTDPGFFGSLGHALAPHFSKEVTDKKAADLYNSLKPVLPEVSPSREWPTWPFLKVEMPISQVDAIRDVNNPLSGPDQVKMVKETATITTADSRALEIFGLAALGPNTHFFGLAKIWLSAFPGKQPEWFDSCCEQIVLAAAEKLLKIRPVSVLQTTGQTEYLPVLTRVRRIPARSIVEFDIHFFDVPGHGGEFVSSKMLTPDQFYWLGLGAMQPAKTNLRKLSEELKSQGKSRLPLLDTNQRAKYIIHRSKIDEFIIANLERADALTLADLLADAQMCEMFKRTFAVVNPQTTVEEAKQAMQKIPDCRDIFVTLTGSADDPVLGWLTNKRVDLLG